MGWDPQGQPTPEKLAELNIFSPEYKKDSAA
jgi:hypothetical protein